MFIERNKERKRQEKPIELGFLTRMSEKSGLAGEEVVKIRTRALPIDRSIRGDEASGHDGTMNTHTHIQKCFNPS